MRILAALAVGLVLVMSGAAPAGGHTGSYDMKYVDGSNLVLLTFNTHKPVTGLDIEHDIRLYDLLGAPIPFDEVTVEVHTQEGGSGVEGLESSLRERTTVPMLATNEASMRFTYPTSGPYRVTTVFHAGGREISRGEFAVDIGRGSGGPEQGLSAWWTGVAFVLGAAMSGLLVRAASRRRSEPPAEGPAAGPAEEPDLDDELVSAGARPRTTEPTTVPR